MQPEDQAESAPFGLSGAYGRSAGPFRLAEAAAPIGLGIGTEAHEKPGVSGPRPHTFGMGHNLKRVRAAWRADALLPLPVDRGFRYPGIS